MKRITFCTFVLFFVFSFGFSQNSLWTKTSDERTSMLEKMDRISIPSTYDLYALNFTAFKNQVAQAPMENQEGLSNVVVSFPNADGKLDRFRIFEAPVMDPALAERFPDIKSYYGKSVDGISSIRFSVTIFGLHVMSVTSETGSYFIDTYTKDLGNYIVYKKQNVTRTSSHFNCLVQDDSSVTIGTDSVNSTMASDGLYRVYRLAMACTIEYAAFHINAAGVGAQPLNVKKAAVLAAMVVTMTRMNGLYERDMAIRMNLVANNDLVIFVDSDSFNNNVASTLINQSQTVIDGAIGSANYDIGHTVSTGGGGLAQLNSPCTTSKARGITGSPAPVGDPFDIDYVAHEMGHQFGATHTQNNACNASAASSVEPGSGSTIMGYAGICPPDVQSNSDAHFHAVSLAQMAIFVAGTGNCAPNNPNGNAAPVVSSGGNFTIPNGTAFVLRGSATDANNDTLSYCWEQTNTQTSTQPPAATSTTGPNFRSRPPVASPNRYMPVFSSVLSGNLVPTWEVVPNVGRTMTFALTARDNRMPNGGQTGRANMTLTFAATGPFRISSPSVAGTSWPTGSSQVLTWDLGGSNAAPINTADVKISYSTDGGASFTTLIATTPNDGSETIVVPSTISSTCRIMIEAIGNIYYCVSRNIIFTNSLSNASFGLDQFVLYPNPNNGSFNIQFNSASSNEIGVTVHDVRGREIFNKNYQNTGTFEQTVQLSNVQKGIYLVTVKDGDRKEVKKIVIE